MKKQLLFCLSLLFAFDLVAQTPLQLTKKVLGGGNGNAEKIVSIDSTRFVVAAKTDGYARAYIVNRNGGVVKSRWFNFLGGIRSEFTDVQVTTGGIVFAGDCDDCVPGFPGRQAFVLKTDLELENAQFRHIPLPDTTAADDDLYFGFQRIRALDDKWVLASQTCVVTGADTSTNLVLTRLDADLNIERNTFYDRYKWDNLGDLETNNNDVYLLTWSVQYFGLNGDTTSFAVLNPDFNLQKESRFRFIGLAMTTIPGTTEDVLIGGSKTDDLTNGPEAYVARINANGDVVVDRKFGTTGKIDAVRDVQMLANGNVMVTATFAQQVPPIDWIFTNTNFLDYEEIGFPYSARVLRLNINTLQSDIPSSQVPNSQAQAVIVRSVVPISPDGRFFVSVGYLNNTPLFFAAVPPAIIGGVDLDNRLTGERDGAKLEGGEIKIYPNPVAVGGSVVVHHGAGAALVQVLSLDGRLVFEQNMAEGEQMLRLPAGISAGLYRAVIRTGEQVKVAALVIAE